MIRHEMNLINMPHNKNKYFPFSFRWCVVTKHMHWTLSVEHSTAYYISTILCFVCIIYSCGMNEWRWCHPIPKNSYFHCGYVCLTFVRLYLYRAIRVRKTKSHNSANCHDVIMMSMMMIDVIMQRRTDDAKLNLLRLYWEIHSIVECTLNFRI